MDNANEKKTGLRFEVSESGGLVFDGADSSVEASVEKKEEFNLPESFEVDEKYNTPAEEKPNIPVKRTYVPRFTSASQNYRIMGSNTPTSNVKTEEKTVHNEPPIDPTAEIEAATTVNPVVVVSTPDRQSDYVDESIKIYKFQSEEPFADKSDADEVFAKAEIERAEASNSEPQPELESTGDESPEVKPEEAVEDNTTAPDYSVSINPMRELYDEVGPLAERAGKSGHGEFNVQSERDFVKDKFLDGLMSVKVRLFAAALISLAIIVASALSYFGNFAFEYIGLLHNGEAVIDLLFAAALLALSIPELVRAFKCLSHRVVCPELALPLSFALLAGYTLTVTLDNTMGADYMSFSVLFAIEVLAAIAASYFRLSSEFKAFKIISRNLPKYVLDTRYTRTLERENMALDGVIDEYSSKIGRIYRTAFVSDFRSHTSRTVENSSNVIIMLSVSLGLGIVSGIVAFLVSSASVPRFMIGYEALMTVFMLAVPTFSLFLHKLPFKHTLDEAAGEGSAFVGEASLYESAEVDVVAYRDTEIFGREDVTVRKVHLYGKVYNTPKAIREMYALFSAVGGPLESVFADSLDRKCQPCDDVTIEDDGIMGTFEGHTVMAGTEEYMRRHKIAIPEDDYKTKTFSTDSTKVMYGAEDGEVYVKFFIRYSFSEEFTMLLPELKARKIVPLVYSSDPNITCELLRVLTLGEDNIRVMRTYQTAAVEKTYRRVSAGAATVGEKTGIVNLLLLAHRYIAFQSSFAISELISMIVGAALAAVLSFAFIGNISGIPGFALAVWQIAWCGVLYVRSKMTFKSKKGK